MAGEQDKPPVVIFQTQDENEASIVQGLLETHGVYSYRTADITHSVYPITVDGLGLIKVLVAGEKEEEARRILREFQEGRPLEDGEEIS
jgi:hypothetical protein